MLLDPDPLDPAPPSRPPRGTATLALALAYAVGVGTVSAGVQSVLALGSAGVCAEEEHPHPHSNRSGNGTAHAPNCERVGDQVVSGYILCYSLFGVAGAFLADTRVGHARAQLISSLVWLAGLLSLSTFLLSSSPSSSSPSIAGTVVSLVATAAAFGAGWSTLSVFVGHQMPRDNSMFWFSMLYVCLNVGDLIAEAGCPLIRQHFSVPAVAMTLAACLGVSVLVFLLGYCRGFAEGEEEEDGDTDDARGAAGQEESAASVLWRTTRIFLALPVYFFLFYQQSDTWTFQARRLNRNVGHNWFTIPADAMPAVNDLLVVAGLPIVALCCQRRPCGLRCLPVQRLAFGIGSAALAFVCAGVLQYAMTSRAGVLPLSIWWQMPQYFFVSLAECFVGSTGLEFAYNEAVPKWRALVTSLWFLSASAGQALMLALSVLFPALTPGDAAAPAQFFFGCAGAMAAVLAVYVCLTRGYKYRHRDYRRAHSIVTEPLLGAAH